MLSVLAFILSMSSSEDDLTGMLAQFAEKKAPQAPTPLDSNVLALLDASSGDEHEGLAPHHTPGSRKSAMRDQRGSYDRSGANKRVHHADQAHIHWTRIDQFCLSNCCAATCMNGQECLNDWSKNDLFCAHEHAYGVLSWASSSDSRSASLSYGRKTLHPSTNASGMWCTGKKEHQTMTHWRQTFQQFVHGTELIYSLDGKRLCAGAMRAVMGMPEATWNKLHAEALQGFRGVEIAEAEREAKREAKADGLSECYTSFSEAVVFWMDQLQEWELIPNEIPPVIKHPIYVVEDVYSNFYIPEMKMFSLAPPLLQRDGKCPSGFYRARTDAVRQLSVKQFGLLEGTTTGEPRLEFHLSAWANHSNYAECDDCHDNRLERLENIRLRKPAARRMETRAKQIKHLGECHAERHVCADLATEASRNPKHIFAVHDKVPTQTLD